MKKVIYRYTILVQHNVIQTITVPQNHFVCEIAEACTPEKISFWMIVDENAVSTMKLSFVLLKTGDEVPPQHLYQKTMKIQNTVYHLFQTV